MPIRTLKSLAHPPSPGPSPRGVLGTWLPVAALVLPLALLGLAAYVLAQQSLRDSVRASQATAADLAARNLRLFFEEKEATGRAFTLLPVFKRAVAARDARLARERLRILAETDPHLTRAFVADARGRLWSDYPVAPEVLEKNFSHREWFRGLSRTGQAYLSGVYQRQAEPPLWALALALPFHGPSGLQGILVLQYSLPDLRSLATEVPVGRDGWLMLVDPGGEVAMHPDLAQDGRRLAHYGALPLLQAALRGRAGDGELRDPATGDVLVATARPLNLFGRDWALAAFQPRSTAYAVLRGLRWQLLLAALLLSLLAGALALRLRRIHLQSVDLNTTLEGQNQELQSLTEELEDANAELQQENEARREVEAELTAIQGHLQEQVEQRTQELADKDQQFQQAQKMEALGRLAGGVAHDFNNLLTVVLGHAELMQGAQDLAQVRESAATIRQAAERGARLTSQLLSFARRQMVKPQALDLNRLIESSMLRTLLGADVQLDLKLEKNLPLVMADPVQLEQALINLVANARDALPRQGGRVTVRTSLPGPDDAVDEPPRGPGRGGCVALAVADNGSGIEASLLPAIFEPFFTTKPVGKGTGLGLPMVQGAVRQAGGQVSVRSAPGEGSEFTLFLPIAFQQPSTAEPDEGATPSSETPHATLLLVEDEEPLRKLAGQLLTRTGYRVLSAPDMAAGLAQARGHAGVLDLLITDLVMPGGSGVDLAHALLDERPDLRVILMTGYTESSLPDPSRLRFRFLQKPFSPAKLLRLVQEALA